MNTDATETLVDRLARMCRENGVTVAVVESLTSGAASSALGRGTSASEWFRGAVVAYQVSTKEAVLGVRPGIDPATSDCAAQLATGGRMLLDADVCVAVTGVGGPEPDGSHPAGEVHIGVATAHGVETESHLFDGDPEAVIEQSVAAVLALLTSAVAETASSARGGEADQDDGIRIDRIRVEDAGEVLTIQRAAFVSEAQIYGGADSAPLTQTLEQLEAELADGGGWVARRANRLVGALRCREADGVLLIGRIAIAPDVQGEGIGRRLLAAAESHTAASVAELFTGSLSEANLRLYRSCGYEETERIDQGDGTAQVFLRKPLR